MHRIVTGDFFNDPGFAPNMSEVILVFLYSLRTRVWKLPNPLVPIVHPWISVVVNEVF